MGTESFFEFFNRIHKNPHDRPVRREENNIFLLRRNKPLHRIDLHYSVVVNFV